jgi:hypothetical protein
MMTYCCADGNIGLRTELEGTERFTELSAQGKNPSARGQGKNLTAEHGDEGGTTGAGASKACVDSFMTNTSKTIEDMFVKYHVDLHLTAHQHVCGARR